MKKFILTALLLVTYVSFSQVSLIRQEAETKGVVLFDMERAILDKAEQIEARFNTLKTYSKEYNLKTLACQLDSDDFNSFIFNLNVLNDIYTNDISDASSTSFDYLKSYWGLTDADKAALSALYVNQLNKSQLPLVYLTDDQYNDKCNLQEVIGLYVADGKIYKTAVKDLFPSSVEQSGNEVFLNLALASIYNRISSPSDHAAIDYVSLNATDNIYVGCIKNAWSSFVTDFVNSKGATIGMGTFSYVCDGCTTLSLWKSDDQLAAQKLSDGYAKCVLNAEKKASWKAMIDTFSNSLNAELQSVCPSNIDLNTFKRGILDGTYTVPANTVSKIEQLALPLKNYANSFIVDNNLVLENGEDSVIYAGFPPNIPIETYDLTAAEIAGCVIGTVIGGFGLLSGIAHIKEKGIQFICKWVTKNLIRFATPLGNIFMAAMLAACLYNNYYD
ncbi:MAG: hypothetical protein CFE24_02310 [Flavobacterium sp. BFFFF2]|nr:MAG: hypothetical protein CFE24_02310 [Flavobacterium sp. BFFFF2]